MSSPLPLLLETAARLFSSAGEDDVQETIDAGRMPEALWHSIDDNGLADIALPEEAGGIGLEVEEALPLLRMAGAFALPVPFAETMIARSVLASAGLPLPEGPVQLWSGAGQAPIAPTIGEGPPVLDGRCALPWGGSLPVVSVSPGSQPGDESLVALLSDPPVHPTEPTLSGEPRSTIELQALALPEGSWSTASASTAERVLRLGAAARSQMIAGAMERILDLTIEYARGRVQFGRPIGRFQAVQQIIARLAGEVAATGVAADAACRSLASGEPDCDAALLAVAAAKSQASTSVTTVAGIAHQVHGAIGYTREHDLQRFTRCLWTWRDLDGDESFWNARAGRLALESGATGLWDLLASS